MKKFLHHGGSRRVASDGFKAFQRFHQVTRGLEGVVEQFKVMDSFGCADRWLLMVLESVGNFVKGFSAFYDEVDVFVQEHMDVPTVVKREDLDGGDLVVSLLVDLLQQRINEVTEAPIDSGELRGVVFAALGNAVEFEVNSDGEGSFDA